jgi:hypothetical protein
MIGVLGKVWDYLALKQIYRCMMEKDIPLQPALWTLQIADSHKRSMYRGLNRGSAFFGRCRSLFLPIREVVTDCVSKPLAAIESLALMIIQFLGAPFSKEYTVENAVFYLEKMVTNLVDVPLFLCTALFRYVHQVSKILLDPKDAAAFREHRYGSEKSSDMRKTLFDFQNNLYSKRDELRKRPGLFAYTVLVDVAIDTLFPIMETIESVRSIARDLLGVILQEKEYSFGKVLKMAGKIHTKVANSFAAVVAFPVKFVYQVCTTLYDSENARSIARKSERDLVAELQGMSDELIVSALQRISPLCIEEEMVEENEPLAKLIPVEKLKVFCWDQVWYVKNVFPLQEEKEPTKEEIARFQTLPGDKLEYALLFNRLSSQWLKHASMKQLSQVDCKFLELCRREKPEMYEQKNKV